jgi:proteasomal ATPase-associated factor 1
LLLAREDCKVQGISVCSRQEIFTAPLPSPANRVIGTGLNTFAVGCQGGQVATFDLRKIVPPKQISFATQTPILDLLSHPRSPASKPTTDEGNKLFWVAKGDGTVGLVNPSLEERTTKFVQLTGSNSDPIYQMKHDGSYIYTACRDGVIRKYSINHVVRLYQ